MRDHEDEEPVQPVVEQRSNTLPSVMPNPALTPTNRGVVRRLRARRRLRRRAR